jgi:hypothetical protein
MVIRYLRLRQPVVGTGYRRRNRQDTSVLLPSNLPSTTAS